MFLSRTIKAQLATPQKPPATTTAKGLVEPLDPVYVVKSCLQLS